jgi:hypothetical protein
MTMSEDGDVAEPVNDLVRLIRDRFVRANGAWQLWWLRRRSRSAQDAACAATREDTSTIIATLLCVTVVHVVGRVEPAAAVLVLVVV